MPFEMAQKNKDTVRSVYEVCLNTGNMELLTQLIAPDFVGVHDDAGPKGFAVTLMGLRTAFPDIHYTVEDVISEGDRVVIRWTWTGTHTAAFRGFAPSQKRVHDSGISIYQLRDAKIVRAWLETNRLGFLQQIGALPPEVSARLPPPEQTKRE